MQTIEKFVAGSYRDHKDFKSFMPSRINVDWTWSDRRLNYLLAEANKALGGLNMYAELLPDIDTYITMHIATEANKSSRIEGTRTSLEEDMMPLDDLDPEKRDDGREVRNYIRALNKGIQRIVEDDFPFSSRLLKELHEELMEGVRGKHKTPGEFRRSQNFLGGSMPSNAIFVPPAVIDLADAMSDFEKFANQDDDLPELIRISILHYQFETIHPFLDGNGRMGRLMIPLYLLSRNELSKPGFYISDYFEQHRTEYYDALQNVRIQNDLLGWICFFLEASAYTAKTAKEKFARAVLLVNEYTERLAVKKTMESAFVVLKAMYKKPVSYVSRLVEQTGLTAPTVRSAIRALQSADIVRELTHGKRNRIYCLHEYLKVFR
jgi:Fic family protein